MSASCVGFTSPNTQQIGNNMNQRFDQLRLSLASVDCEIKSRNDAISRLQWELGLLVEQKSELLKSIAEETLVKNPCRTL